ncbi:MAG TPA: undecaprenyldiphospho-muramoylpentapeptide beta-N-acetylglucosaminyltransferase [Gammaproteobacteria bacterium]|nr:undecaprenyldiphospho-muramoylpentapeptide beta-N-acetylglucosaminyltransferase [Gammaproteobacteria bacterium]
MRRPVMIMAGGTGGHIFPALAVAQSLTQQKVPVVWLGARGGMESRLVPAAGYPLVELAVKGLRGKGAIALLLAPFKISIAVVQALIAVLKYRPRAVLGLGGFASGPGGLAAWILHRPLLIHEQNSIPGLTNRWLAGLSRCVMEGFPDSFRAVRVSAPVVHVGNPVRASIRNLPETRVRLTGRQGHMRIFVVGGSLGALSLNTVVPGAVARLSDEVEIWHQTGERHLEQTRETYQAQGVKARVDAFIDDMAEAYGWADLVIARSGALTVTELAQAGVASVLIPYPYAVDDHQTANAQKLVRCGAGVMIADADLNVETLSACLAELCRSRETLLEMGEQTRPLRKPDAADVVAGLCLGTLNPLELQEVQA